MPIGATAAWAEASAAVPKDDVQLVTLELHHPAFLNELGQQTAIRAVRNTEDCVLTLEVGAPLGGGLPALFTAIPFEIDGPRIGPLGAYSTLKLDNVNREVSRYLDAATRINSPVLAIFRGYMASDPTAVAYGPFRLELRTVSRRLTYLEGSLVVASPGDLKFLRRVYDMRSFPSLMATVAQ